jgi:hypothetical protein
VRAHRTSPRPSGVLGGLVVCLCACVCMCACACAFVSLSVCARVRVVHMCVAAKAVVVLGERVDADRGCYAGVAVSIDTHRATVGAEPNGGPCMQAGGCRRTAAVHRCAARPH